MEKRFCSECGEPLEPDDVWLCKSCEKVLKEREMNYGLYEEYLEETTCGDKC